MEEILGNLPTRETREGGVRAREPMVRRVRLETPEHVRLGYDLADLGSRFTAMATDLAIMAVVLTAVMLSALLLARYVAGAVLPEYGRATLWALAMVGVFVVQWGYFVLFEAYWDGRTPGKRLMGLRVLHSGGQPLSPRGSVVRNLLRIVDLQPGLSGVVGGTCMMLGRRTQRLGDLAADSIVVRDRGGGDIPWPESPGVAVRGRPLLSEEQFALLSGFVRRRAGLTAEVRERVEHSVIEALRPVLEDHPKAGRVPDGEFLGALHDEEAARRGSAAEGWDLQAAALVRGRKAEWDAYRALVSDARKRGLHGLSERKVRSFGRLYRTVTADLARARTYRAPAGVVFGLEKWAGAGHSLLYRARRRSGKAVGRWLAAGLPRAVRRHRRATALAALLLFGPMAGTYQAVRGDPALARSIMPAEMLARAENTAQGDIDAQYLDMPGGAMPMLASSVMVNNLGVAFVAFGGGMLAGAGTALLLVVNGVFLGAAFGLYANQQVLGVILAFVSPHGVFELTAICLAGAAGLTLGSALLVPGRRTRRTALVERGRSALSVLAGSGALLVVAGVVEGFYSPSALPAVAKFGFGGASAVLLAVYLGVGGRGGLRPQRVSAAAPAAPPPSPPAGAARRSVPGGRPLGGAGPHRC